MSESGQGAVRLMSKQVTETTPLIVSPVEAAALIAEGDQICAEVGRHGHPQPHHTQRLREINRLLEAIA